MTKNNFARALVVWFLTSLGVFFTGVLTGFYARDLVIALIATAGLGLINALLWPLLSRLALAHSVITFALSALLMNGVIIWLLSFFTSEIEVSWLGLFFLAFNIALINTVVSGILTIDDDASFYREVFKKTKGRAKKATKNKDKPGFIFLKIDGLAETILRKAIDNGTMPTLAGLDQSRNTQDKRMGNRLFVPDWRKPSGNITWEQQRHPCLPMGGKSERQQGYVNSWAGRCPRDRGTHHRRKWFAINRWTRYS